MFKARIDEIGRSGGLKIYVWCPECGEATAFMYCCPPTCVKCGRVMPNILSLMNCDMDKMIYHNGGYTINTERDIRISGATRGILFD